MKKIDWVHKLTSRKFWSAVCSFVYLLLIALGKPKEFAVQVIALIMAGASVIALIIGDGLNDTDTPSPPLNDDGKDIENKDSDHV